MILEGLLAFSFEILSCYKNNGRGSSGRQIAKYGKRSRINVLFTNKSHINLKDPQA